MRRIDKYDVDYREIDFLEKGPSSSSYCNDINELENCGCWVCQILRRRIKVNGNYETKLRWMK